MTTCEATAKASSNGNLSARQAQSYCQLTLTCAEKKLTAQRFKKVDSNMIEGKSNPDVKAVTDCAKRSAKTLK